MWKTALEGRITMANRKGKPAVEMDCIPILITANKIPWYNCAWEHHKPFEARCITLKVKEYNGPKKKKQLNPEAWYHLDYIR